MKTGKENMSCLETQEGLGKRKSRSDILGIYMIMTMYQIHDMTVKRESKITNSTLKRIPEEESRTRITT